MKTIIIPTDFSPVATNALYYGIDMAKAIDSSVMLVHIYNIPIAFSEVPVLLISVEELKNAAETRLADLKKEVELISPGKITVLTETRMGNIVDELENICSEVKPFAVVMGSSGASGIEKVLFGSTTLSVIKHLTWPVIVVPPGKGFGKGIKKIGLASDFTNVVNTTPAPFIKELVKELNAELHVLNVDYHNRHFDDSKREESRDLHDMLEPVNPEYHFIENKSIEDGITEFAGKNDLDLLITLPKKHSLLEGIFKTSASRQIVFQSHIPVLCLHE